MRDDQENKTRYWQISHFSPDFSRNFALPVLWEIPNYGRKSVHQARLQFEFFSSSISVAFPFFLLRSYFFYRNLQIVSSKFEIVIIFSRSWQRSKNILPTYPRSPPGSEKQQCVPSTPRSPSPRSRCGFRPARRRPAGRSA